MMLLIVTSLLMITSAVQSVGMFFPKLKETPCCYPPQLHGTMSEYVAFSSANGTGAGAVTISIPELYLDYGRHEAAGTETIYHNGILIANITFIAMNSITYVVNNTNNGKCQKYSTPPIDHQLNQCIRSEAKYLGYMTLGHGPQSLRVNTWQTLLRADTTVVITQTAVTSFSCLPVMGSFDGTDVTSHFVGSWVFSDVKPRIIEPLAAFAIPASCQGLSETLELPHGHHHGIGNALHSLALLNFVSK